MKRKDFITLFCSAAVTWPLTGHAQQSERIGSVGVLMNLALDDAEGKTRLAAFRHALQELGWTDGRNVRIETRGAGGDPAKYRQHAAELVALAPDVVLAITTVSVLALQQASRTLPLVFVQVIDPVGSGLVASLARPGGNATVTCRSSGGFTGSVLAMPGAGHAADCRRRMVKTRRVNPPASAKIRPLDLQLRCTWRQPQTGTALCVIAFTTSITIESGKGLKAEAALNSRASRSLRPRTARRRGPAPARRSSCLRAAARC